VIYTAATDKTGDTDVFTYNAQATDTPASAPEKITIRISDSVPKLEIQEVADAGRIVMGHPKALTVKIRNAGNAPWAANLPAPKGWRWLKPEAGNFSLAPGATIESEIECEALTATTLDETITLPGDKKTRFRATVVTPFTAPVLVTLKWNSESRVRTGAIEVQNLDRESPVKVKATGPEWLTLPADELTVEPDGKASLSVSIKGDFGKPFSGALKLTSGASSQIVQVKAVPAPAILRVVSGISPDGEVAFGKLDADTIKTARRSITLHNDGGTATVVTPGELKVFTLETPGSAKAIPLAPGGEATLVFLPPTDIAGTHREPFSLTDGESHVELHLTAEIPESAIPDTPGKIAGGKLLPRTQPGIQKILTRSEMETRKARGQSGLSEVDGHEDPTVPRINDPYAEILDGSSAIFSWDMPEGDGWTFKLYFPTVESVKTGGVAKMFIACGDEVKYSINGRRASATVTGLRPNVWRKFRIKTIAPDGRSSLLGKEFGVQLSDPVPTHWQEYWEWYVTGLVGGAGLFYWLRKKWREPVSAVAA
jgi:hypothetical protein